MMAWQDSHCLLSILHWSSNLFTHADTITWLSTWWVVNNFYVMWAQSWIPVIIILSYIRDSNSYTTHVPNQLSYSPDNSYYSSATIVSERYLAAPILSFERFLLFSVLLIWCCILFQCLRSTAAANKLEEEGFQNLSCITSGLQSVKPGFSL